MRAIIKEIFQLVQCKSAAKRIIKNADNIYKEASVFVENIPKEKITEAVSQLFRPIGQPNQYLQDLSELKRLAEDAFCPKEIKEIIIQLERDAKTLIEKSENFSAGSKRALKTENYNFGNMHKAQTDKILDYYTDKYWEELIKLDNPDTELMKKYKKLKEVSERFSFGRQPLDLRIGELPKGVLPENGQMYHGTTKARKIKKEGFSAFRTRQINVAPREFGAGIYLTPKKEVASNFAGISGRIMPVRANVEHTALVEEESFRQMSDEAIKLAIEAGINVNQRSPHNIAVQELILKRLFREAGYDSVYTANSMHAGLFTRSADDFFGKAQSQLVVFDPEKITLGEKKKLKERIKDEIMQIKSLITQNINAYKIAKEDPLCLAFMS